MSSLNFFHDRVWIRNFIFCSFFRGIKRAGQKISYSNYLVINYVRYMLLWNQVVSEPPWYVLWCLCRNGAVHKFDGVDPDVPQSAETALTTTSCVHCLVFTFYLHCGCSLQFTYTAIWYLLENDCHAMLCKRSLCCHAVSVWFWANISIHCSGRCNTFRCDRPRRVCWWWKTMTMCMTRSLNITPKTTLRSGKFEA